MPAPDRSVLACFSLGNFPTSRQHTAGDELLHMFIATPTYEEYVKEIYTKQVGIGNIYSSGKRT